MTQKTEKSTTASVLGIISLILAIIAVILSFIPLIGIGAMIVGALSIILAVLAYFFTSSGQSKTIILAAFILAHFSIIFAYWRYQEIKNKAKSTLEQISDELDEIKQLESLDSLDSNVGEMRSRLDSL